jgi:hypothetical protein
MVFLLAVAIALPVAAKSNKRGEAGVKVVSHFRFEGRTAVDLALTAGSGRRYLYVRHPQDGGVSILDVTNLSHPKLLSTTFWPEGAELGTVTFMGDYAIGKVLAINDNAVVGDGPALRTGFLSRKLQPKGFGPVKRAIFDGGVVFLLTDTGVWIVESPSTRP